MKKTKHSIFLFLLLFCTINIAAQENSETNDILTQAIKNNINSNYIRLFPGLFYNNNLNTAISFLDTSSRSSKYSQIERVRKTKLDSNRLLKIVKKLDFSESEIKEKCLKMLNIPTIHNYEHLRKNNLETFSITNVENQDTVLRTFHEKQNRTFKLCSNSDSTFFKYDEKSRLTAIINKNLENSRDWRNNEYKKWVQTNCYFDYFGDTIRMVNISKDTMTQSLSRKEYKKKQQEIEKFKAHPEEGSSNVFYKKINRNQYVAYFPNERRDTFRVRLNALSMPLETIKSNFNRPTISNYTYDSENKLLRILEESYGSNEFDGKYIDSSKIEYKYNKDGFLEETSESRSGFHIKKTIVRTMHYKHDVKKEIDGLKLSIATEGEDKSKANEEPFILYFNKKGQITKTIVIIEFVLVSTIDFRYLE